MADIKDIAVNYHNNGFNCAQSVFMSCEEYTGLDSNAAAAIAAGLGGGVRCGEICGAISGAVLSLGAAFPFTDASDIEAKEKIAALTKECVARSRELFGKIRCEDIKGDGSSCERYIAEMVAIAKDIIENNK